MVDDNERAARRTTEGRSLLAKALEADGWNASRLARALKISQPSVAAWMAGSARPTPPLRRALEQMFGIPTIAWETSHERQQGIVDPPASTPSLPTDDAPDAA